MTLQAQRVRRGIDHPTRNGWSLVLKFFRAGHVVRAMHWFIGSDTAAPGCMGPGRAHW